MLRVRAPFVSASFLAIAIAAAAGAQPAWGPMGPPGYYPDDYLGPDPREGKIEAARYTANSPQAQSLGHGAITIASAPGSMALGLEDVTYETAVAGELGKAGYSTDPAAPAGQIAELTVRHALVQPPEPPHSPVAGQVAVGGGNRGSGVGIGIALDFSKPLKALIATRLEARIRDRATNEILWEGHAEVMTREGDKHWTTQALATRLAIALFKGFPHAS